MRSIPRFDYQARHLLRARRMLQENSRNLADMREMAASRASLSFLDTSTRDISDNDSMLSRSNSRVQLYKSYDSLDALSTGDMIPLDEDFGKGFLSDLLRHIALKDNNNTMSSSSNSLPGDDDENAAVVTSRDLYNGAREDVSTESGVTVSDETSLLLEARPSPVDMGKQKEVVATLVKFLKQRLPMRVTEVLEFGSVGSGTLTRSRMDVDLIVFSPDLPATGQYLWMPSVLHAALSFLQNASSSPDPFFPLPKCSYFATTPLAVQMTCGGVDVDIMFTYDWESDENGQGGYPSLYNQSIKQTTRRARRWCALATSRLQKKFVAGQPNEVKEIVKVVKHWRNCTQWRKSQYRPNSYLLTLLIIKAVEDTKSTDMKRVLQRLGALVLAPELSISWSTYYVPDKYPCEFDPPTPLVRDPANPGYNVAETLSYWGQFRAELIAWMKSLGVNVCNVDTIMT